jgi:hypothetical protein
MIYESTYWKNDLLKTCSKLENFSKQKALDAQMYTCIEKDLLYGFYAIRKLFEASMKITDRIKSSTFSISYFNNMGNKINWLNKNNIDENYDLEREHKEDKKLVDIFNQFIHSDIFIVYPNDRGGFGGVFVVSDRKKNKRLNSLTCSEIIKIFTTVASDDVKSIQWERCGQTGAEKINVE